jgi:hypothetical protein
VVRYKGDLGVYRGEPWPTECFKRRGICEPFGIASGQTRLIAWRNEIRKIKLND